MKSTCAMIWTILRGSFRPAVLVDVQLALENTPLVRKVVNMRSRVIPKTPTNLIILPWVRIPNLGPWPVLSWDTSKSTVSSCLCSTATVKAVFPWKFFQPKSGLAFSSSHLTISESPLLTALCKADDVPSTAPSRKRSCNSSRLPLKAACVRSGIPCAPVA